MINKQFLEQFCHKVKSAPTSKPWSIGQHTYATDGKVLLRVKRIDEISENEACPNFPLTGLQKWFEKQDGDSFFDLPECAPKIESCSCCQGTGLVEICQDCNGEGVIFLESKLRHEYTFECEHCKGLCFLSSQDEVSEMCIYCNGAGVKIEENKIQIGPAFLSTKYIYLLKKELNNIEICPRSDLNPAYFKFDGGDGILMPMRA